MLISLVLMNAALSPPQAGRKTNAPPKSVAAKAANPVLYNFKGVRLEISIDEFSRLPHPDGDKSTVVCTGEKIPITKSYSSEPVYTQVYDEVELSLGVKRCIWVITEGAGVMGAGSTAPLGYGNTGYGSYSYSFFFIKDPKDGVYRLYKYEGTTNVAAYEGVVAALSTKWGPPKRVAGTVQNKIGNSFDQETAIWSNHLSSIEVESRWSKIDDMRLTMTDYRLAGIVFTARSVKNATKKNAF